VKNLGIVGDYPSWTYISDIIDEMQSVSKRYAIKHPELASQLTPLEPILIEKFSELDIDFSFCFRCLDRNSGWVSKARLWKNDDQNSFNAKNNIAESSRTLGFDIVVYEEDFLQIKKDKDAQKKIIGFELLRFLKLTLPKYIKKIPMTKEEMQNILDTIENWLIKHNWL